MFHFKKCDGCNRDLPLGTTKYKVRIEVTSDFDGFLQDNETDDEAERINELFEQIQQLSPEELENDVHMEFEMILCRECRNRFVEEMENYSESGLNSKTKQPLNLH